MGVYINMEMPTDCGKCRFAVDGWCYAYGKPNIDALANDGRTNFCPLIPVPPHGRLIDADALAEKHRELAYELRGANYDFHMTARSWVNSSPTIIPAEEGENVHR